ncbi:dipeptidyl peptidase 8-like protein [Euroglyphus maynei]|uniref:Prolyl endopeptidase n=1 Tax=Euroglyphus maynei TaxID=6958 RepID=A0A1Y3B773_EURMA|nr:dipeptidyl peptidase 8-like protein [Euroglyphus maynei]
MADRFPSQIIHTESHHDHWYNCHEILYFFKNKSCIIDNDNRNNDEDVIVEGSKVEFLWSSEVTGFRHLYKIAVEIGEFPKKMQLMDEEKSMEKKNQESNHEVKARLLTNHQLTNGNWEVSESMYWVDQQNGLIYFLGTRDSPLENHLYVISSSQSSRIAPRRLSKEDFTHTRIVFDPEFRFCIDFQSNVSIPPFIYLHRLSAPTDNPSHINLEPQYIFLNLPDDIRVEDSMEYYEKVQILGPTPHLFECKLRSGELIYGFLFKPEFMEPGFKYPVLLEIYGGPEVQSVTKSFKDLRCHRRHLIASEGYIVVGFDSRGSKHRGVEFEKHIYKRLGQVEIDDQVEALQWLADNTGFIDMNRVAIHGWSFGGYLSLMALVKRPDVFKCAIAGAPVTNWLLYDTGYTERYMGLPSENEENYRRSSILSYIKHFPNEYNRLLIIHGLMDENVHFCHTAQLIQGLVMAGKPYQLSIYPYERHSLKKINSAEHVEATLIHYLQQNL